MQENPSLSNDMQRGITINENFQKITKITQYNPMKFIQEIKCLGFKLI